MSTTLEGKKVVKVRKRKKIKISEEVTVGLLQHIINKVPIQIHGHWQVAECENCGELVNLDRFEVAQNGYQLCQLCKAFYPPKKKQCNR